MASARPDGTSTRETAMSNQPLTIGWKEYLEFPDWGLRRVKVKIDTGARTSALGALSYELRQTDGEGTVAELRLALYRRRPERVKTIRVPVLEMLVVSNSGGMRELRPVIQANIRLGPVTKSVRLTVANRACMLFPVILGRKALEGDFVVDVSRKYVLQNA
jgi:hypothetical protein